MGTSSDEGPLTLPAAAEILNQSCAALDEAHRQQIVHRDIKPDNIIVNTAGSRLRVKVLDFGIAKLRDLAATATNLTQTGTVMGTPHYMSPEQCLGEELDGRSDIYSLGVVLYEMLTGIVPFNSPTSTAVVVQHVSQAPPAPRAINLSIPEAAERVILHALAKRREERPQTAAALAEELTAAVNQTASGPVVSAWVSSPAPTLPPSTTPMEGRGRVLEQTQVMSTPASGRELSISGPRPSVFAPAAEPLRRGVNPLWLTVAAVGVLAVGAALWLFVGRGKASDGPKPGGATEVVTPPPGMAYVPGGEFTMGSDSGDGFERPAHRVTVKPFFIDLREVTGEEYEKFLRATGRAAPPTWKNGELPPGASRRPVTGVTWDDAQAYAGWAGKRLPTEEGWEFAARGTDGRLYPWGNEWKSGYANAGATAVGHMADVGAHAAGASPYGLLDMAGNAWEWTASDLVAYPGGELPADRPGGELKVIRGGCWQSNQNQATATFRRGWPMRGANDYGDTGFRCARDLVPSQAQAAALGGPQPVVDNSLVGIIRNSTSEQLKDKCEKLVDNSLVGIIRNSTVVEGCGTACVQRQPGQPNDAEACAACGTCGAGMGIIVLVPIVLLVLNIALLVWVARDAKARGMDSAVLWMLLVFFTSIIGLVIYLFSRPQGNLVQCPSCGNNRLQASARCPHCGNV